MFNKIKLVAGLAIVIVGMVAYKMAHDEKKKAQENKHKTQRNSKSASVWN